MTTSNKVKVSGRMIPDRRYFRRREDCRVSRKVRTMAGDHLASRAPQPCGQKQERPARERRV